MALFDRKKTDTDLDEADSAEPVITAPDADIGGAAPEPRTAKKADGAFPDTHVGEEVVLEGTLRFKGGARVDGIVKGRIVSEDRLEVGPEAELEAQVDVGVLVLQGAITGNVHARVSAEIHDEGELRGDLRTPALQVHRGAMFFGHCDMGGED